MQFASKTPELIAATDMIGDFTFHACDYMDACSNYGWPVTFTNPPNLVLAEYRSVDEEERQEYAMEVAHLFWDIDHDLVAEDVTLLVDAAMVEHAYRVLRRLHGF